MNVENYLRLENLLVQTRIFYRSYYTNPWKNRQTIEAHWEFLSYFQIKFETWTFDVVHLSLGNLPLFNLDQWKNKWYKKVQNKGKALNFVILEELIKRKKVHVQVQTEKKWIPHKKKWKQLLNVSLKSWDI